jgi:hypothetical protein
MSGVWVEAPTDIQGFRRFEQVGSLYAVHGYLISGSWHWEVVKGSMWADRVVLEGFPTVDDAMEQADAMMDEDLLTIA